MPGLLVSTGWALIVAGFVMAIFAVLILFAKTAGGEGEARGGGVVLLGPIPIVFGSDQEMSKVVLLLALALVVVTAVLLYLPRFL